MRNRRGFRQGCAGAGPWLFSGVHRPERRDGLIVRAEVDGRRPNESTSTSVCAYASRVIARSPVMYSSRTMIGTKIRGCPAESISAFMNARDTRPLAAPIPRARHDLSALFAEEEHEGDATTVARPLGRSSRSGKRGARVPTTGGRGQTADREADAGGEGAVVYDVRLLQAVLQRARPMSLRQQCLLRMWSDVQNADHPGLGP